MTPAQAALRRSTPDRTSIETELPMLGDILTGTRPD
jgi:hypothetical protein